MWLVKIDHIEATLNWKFERAAITDIKVAAIYSESVVNKPLSPQPFLKIIV